MADAEGLNPSGGRPPYGFDPRPGHRAMLGEMLLGVDDYELLEASPFAALVGPIHVSRISPATFRVVVGPTVVNTMGRIHGGFVAALIDIAAGQGTRRLLADGRGIVTVTSNIEYLGTARVGDTVDIDVTVDRDTPNVVFSSCRLTVDGRPVARAPVVFSAREAG